MPSSSETCDDSSSSTMLADSMRSSSFIILTFVVLVDAESDVDVEFDDVDGCS